MKHWFNRPPSAPSWASFWSGEQYGRFVEYVKSELGRRGVQFEMGDGVVRVLGQAAGKSNELGLQNLAQKCRMARSENEWPDIVRGHLEQVVGSGRDEIDEAMARANDLGAVRDQLKLRLYPRSMLANVPTDALVSWPVADDLLAVLVLDLPQTVATVGADQRRAWSVSDEELHALALSNVKRFDPPQLDDFEIAPGVPARALVGDHFFVASHALQIARFVDPTEHGLLVIVPHRHATLVHRITGPEVLQAVNHFLGLARRMHLEGPGSITDQLYWWHDGVLERQPSEVNEQTLTFRPTSGFEQMLSRLMT
ncbi:MAG: hypothetical protein H6722_22125 [Sandaracinus sp.]|nr:hypothetical protein [Sandaracinus sp.]